MSQISYDEVNLMLRLYDLRREPRLREARAWFVDHFHAGTPEELMQKYPQGSQENTYIRMVISYWEMVAGIVNRGLINDELFFESNGELWVVWDRMRTIVPTWRAAFKNPTLFSGIEETCKRLEAWRERRAPVPEQAQVDDKRGKGALQTSIGELHQHDIHDDQRDIHKDRALRTEVKWQRKTGETQAGEARRHEGNAERDHEPD